MARFGCPIISELKIVDRGRRSFSGEYLGGLFVLREGQGEGGFGFCLMPCIFLKGIDYLGILSEALQKWFDV